MVKALWILIRKLFRSSPKLKSFFAKLAGGGNASTSFLKQSGINVRNISKIQSKIRNRLMVNPKKLLDEIKRAPRDVKAEMENLINGVPSGVKVILNSSWLEWGVFEYRARGSKVGRLTLKVLNPSNPNPSGIYTWPSVSDYVFNTMIKTDRAGTAFWALFYGQWSLSSGRISNWKGPSGILTWNGITTN